MKKDGYEMLGTNINENKLIENYKRWEVELKINLVHLDGSSPPYWTTGTDR